jgi:hypothetical protein
MTGPRRLLLLVLVLISAFAAEAAGETSRPSGRFEIELLTVYPGDHTVTMFGHSALRVFDRRDESDWVFNWGTIRVTPDLAWRFVGGGLVYFVSVESFERAMRGYRRENRRVVGQLIDLPPVAAAQMVRAMEQNALPENAEYAYHHFDANCTTKVRDLIDQHTGGALRKVAVGPSARTLRHHLYQVGAPPVETVLGLDVTTNARLDQPITNWEALFLGQNLHTAMAQASRVDGMGPLVRAERVHHERKGPPPARVAVRPGWVVFGGSALLLLIVLGASLRDRPLPTVEFWGLMVLGLFAGLAGLLSVVLWSYSDLAVFTYNQCMIHLWPTDLALIVVGPIGLARGGRWAAGLWTYLVLHVAVSGVALLLLAIGVLQQQVWPMAVPSLVAFAAAAAVVWRAWHAEDGQAAG